MRQGLALLVFFALTAYANAQTYFIKPVTSTSVSAEELQSVTELVRMAVSGVDGASVTEDEGKADAVLAPKVLKLGSAYVLGISKIQNGKVVNQQQARAKSIEDMDTVAGRVARAVITEVKVEKDMRVNDVTEDEVTRGKRRIEPISQWFFGFGPSRLINMGTEETGVYLNFGHSWGIDSNFSLTLGYEMLLIRKALLGNLSLGGDIFLNDHNTSPYATVAFGYSGVNPNEESAFYVSADRKNGFSLAAGLGIRFFRTSRVNLSLSAKYIYVLEKTQQGNPAGTVAAVTLYY